MPIGDRDYRALELHFVLGPRIAERAAGLFAPRCRSACRATHRDAPLLRKHRATERLAIETDSAYGSLVEVIGCIRTRDCLVACGGERLLPGQRVEIVAADEAAAW